MESNMVGIITGRPDDALTWLREELDKGTVKCCKIMLYHSYTEGVPVSDDDGALLIANFGMTPIETVWACEQAKADAISDGDQ